MKEISLRDFLRNYKDCFPLPQEGIKVVRRDEPDFYVCPNLPETSSSKLRKIAQFIVQEMQDEIPVKALLDARPKIAPIITPTITPKITPVITPVIGPTCEAKSLLPWEPPCKLAATEHVAVASLKDGEPMDNSDWKEFHLCSLHRKVLEQLGDYEVEDV